MFEQYAIVPYVAQASVPRNAQEFKPKELSQRLGMDLFRFLEPLVCE